MSQIGAGNEACPTCGQRPELQGRYRLDRELESSASRGRAFRATRLDDTMLARVYTIELEPAVELDRAEALAAQLDELRHSKLARPLEVWLDAETRRLWLLHEPVTGRSLAEIAAEDDERLADPRWVLSIAQQLGELLAFAHAQQPPLLGLDLGLDALVVRHGLGRAQRKGPPRLCLIELRPDPRVPSDADERAREDLRVLASSLSALLGAGQPDPDPRWRTHPGLDEELRGIVERMLDPASEPALTAAQIRHEIAARLDRRRQAPAMAATHRPPRAQPKPVASRMRPGPLPLSRESVQRPRPTPRDDVPVMRPADLSRELSQAHHATEAIEARQRKQLTFARVMLVVLVALIAALTTYIFIR